MEDRIKSIIILGVTIALFGMLLVVGLLLQRQVWLGINPYIFIGAACVFAFGITGGDKPFHTALRIIALLFMIGSLIYMVVCCVIYPTNEKMMVYVGSCDFVSERQYGLNENKKEYTFNVTSTDGHMVVLQTRDSSLYINLLTKCKENRSTNSVKYVIVYQPYKNDYRMIEVEERIE